MLPGLVPTGGGTCKKSGSGSSETSNVINCSASACRVQSMFQPHFCAVSTEIRRIEKSSIPDTVQATRYLPDLRTSGVLFGHVVRGRHSWIAQKAEDLRLELPRRFTRLYTRGRSFSLPLLLEERGRQRRMVRNAVADQVIAVPPETEMSCGTACILPVGQTTRMCGFRRLVAPPELGRKLDASRLPVDGRQVLCLHSCRVPEAIT